MTEHTCAEPGCGQPAHDCCDTCGSFYCPAHLETHRAGHSGALADDVEG